jgi:hypothetical protein
MLKRIFAQDLQRQPDILANPAEFAKDFTAPAAKAGAGHVACLRETRGGSYSLHRIATFLFSLK